MSGNINLFKELFTAKRNITINDMTFGVKYLYQKL